MEFPLIGDRIELRPFVRADTAAMHTIYRKEEVMRRFDPTFNDYYAGGLTGTAAGLFGCATPARSSATPTSTPVA